MKKSIVGKNVPLTTTPVSSGFKDSSTIYRSLLAAPANLEINRSTKATDRLFDEKLHGPQSKGQGQFVYSETKQSAVDKSEKQPCPIPLIVANAPTNSFLVESQPISKVITAVNELFAHHEVDATFDESKFKWKCICYNSGSETRFVARLFSVPDKANFFVLDLQRRSGDPFHFQSIYRALNFRLLKSGFVVCGDAQAKRDVPVPEFRVFKPLELPSELSNTLAAEDTVDLEPILRMCGSSYVDVQREGLLALIASLENKTASTLPVNFAVKLMELVAVTRDEQVRRLATSALAEMANNTAVVGELGAKGAVRLFMSILANESEILETRRKAATLLTNFSAWDSYSLSTLKTSVDAKADAKLNALVTTLRLKHLGN